MDHIDPVAVIAAAAALVALGRSFMRKKLTLAQIATLACDSGEHNESPTVPRWRISHEAAVRLDESDNGQRDYSDAQLRLAVDAEAKRRGWVVR